MRCANASGEHGKLFRRPALSNNTRVLLKRCRLVMPPPHTHTIVESTAAAAAGGGACPSSLNVKKLQRTALALAAHKGPPSSRFKVLQWNILADGLAQHGDFVKVAPEVLEWDYRFQLVLAEVAESAADIICIQELNHYDQLLSQLRVLGYEGTFLPKNCSPAARYQCPADGLAIFHSTKRFDCVAEPLGHTYLDANGQKHSQGFLQVRLRDRHAQRELVIATTHLKSKEGAVEEQTRIRQLRQLLHHLKQDLIGDSPSVATAAPARALAGSLEEQLACQCSEVDPTLLGSMPDEGLVATNGSSGRRCGDGSNGSNGTGPGSSAAAAEAAASTNGSGPPSPAPDAAAAGSRGSNGAGSLADAPPVLVPVIITGDFNATPDSVPCLEMKAHPSGFQSIWDVKPYKPSPPADPSSSREDKEFSTWKFRSKGESKRIIDHIWFTKGRRLVPTSRWRMLTEAEIGPAALPSPTYASDHQALCCEFEWQD